MVAMYIDWFNTFILPVLPEGVLDIGQFLGNVLEYEVELVAFWQYESIGAGADNARERKLSDNPSEDEDEGRNGKGLREDLFRGGGEKCLPYKEATAPWYLRELRIDLSTSKDERISIIVDASWGMNQRMRYRKLGFFTGRKKCI